MNIFAHMPRKWIRQVIARHIELYVNNFTEDYGSEGRAAIDCLLERARAMQTCFEHCTH